MSISFHASSAGTYARIVAATGNVLTKGQAFAADNNIDADSLVTARLHEDMADLQFQVVCVAHHSLGALKAMQAGEFRPPVNDTPMDYAGLQALMAQTLNELTTLETAAIDDLAGGNLVFKIGGNELPFTNQNFLLGFSLPNFYFHATTAYDILRQQGVPLSKLDFLGEMPIG